MIFLILKRTEKAKLIESEFKIIKIQSWFTTNKSWSNEKTLPESYCKL